MRPLSDNILVRRLEVESITTGGIHIPDNAATDRQRMGVVIAVGNGKQRKDGSLSKPEVKAGDTVLLDKRHDFWQDLKWIDGMECLWVKAGDVLAVIEGVAR